MKKPHSLKGVPLSVVRRIILKTRTMGECWIFQGHRDRKGYGKIRVEGKMQLAHRVMLAAFTPGGLKSGLYAHHKCYTTSCVNPDHLEATTIEYNTAERNYRNGRKVEDVPF